MLEPQDISEDIDFTTSYVNSQFRKYGNMVFISYQSEAKVHSVNELLFEVPAELRPPSQILAVCTLNTNAFGLVSLSAVNGQCTISQLSATPGSNTRIYFQMIYFTK